MPVDEDKEWTWKDLHTRAPYRDKDSSSSSIYDGYNWGEYDPVKAKEEIGYWDPEKKNEGHSTNRKK